VYKVKNLITTVSVRTSPDKAWFFRTNTDVNYSLDAGLLVQKDEGKIYFVIPSLLADETVTGFIKPYQIRTCITRQSQPFLWALRLQTSDKTDNWATSALAERSTSLNKLLELMCTIWSYRNESYVFA